MTEQRTDYDSPWKEIIERFFPRLLEFFFPPAYTAIDWMRPYEFLDTELQQLDPEAEVGRRLADKVVKVWLNSGEEAWVLVHLEVQGQYDSNFAQRIYIYNYRLYDRHKKRVISLAILADEETNWRPSRYSYELGGCRVSLEFPIAKLLDYANQWETLEQTTNPFGIIVMAHLKAKATYRDPENRLQWKLNLVRNLFERGYSREDILDLFRFIDWIMVLPEELANNFKAELRKQVEASRMRYVTSIERLAIQEGIVQNARENVIEILEIRFSEVPTEIVESINQIDDASVLKTLLRTAITIASIAEFQQILTEVTSPRNSETN